MPETTDDLIERLSASGTPVRPLSSPIIRALATLLPMLTLMTIGAYAFGNTQPLIDHLSEPVFATGFLASLVTGISAVIAALHLSIPGRSESWSWAPLLPAATWFGVGFWQCSTYVGQNGIHEYNMFASADCFVFIAMTGTVIAVTLFASLRNRVSTNLFAVTALCGLGAATLANTMLAAFHPPATNPIDFLTHIVAGTAIIVYMATLGRSALKSP